MTSLGTDSEHGVLDEWTATVERAASNAVEAVEGLSAVPPVEAVIGRGSSWAEAIDDIGLYEGDVLVVGLSELRAGGPDLPDHARPRSCGTLQLPRSWYGAVGRRL